MHHSDSTAAVISGWRAELALTLASRHGRTVMTECKHLGPLRLQRPFYPEGSVPHLYLLHPPGGVVGGDELLIDVSVRAGAQALITTPAAGKFYRSGGPRAALMQRIALAADACLEWLPQETIVYAGARADSKTRVDLAGNARFIGWEILCLGRPASSEAFLHGDLRQRFEIWRDGKPIWLERARFDGGAPALQSAWGLRGHTLAATLVAVGRIDGLVEQVRAAVQVGTDEAFSVTQLDEVLVCRYLGSRAQRARGCLSQAWAVLRPAIMNRAVCAPRVWNT